MESDRFLSTEEHIDIPLALETNFLLFQNYSNMTTARVSVKELIVPIYFRLFYMWNFILRAIVIGRGAFYRTLYVGAK